MTINLKNYFVMSILILSASSMAQNNVFADGTNNFGILASSYINTSPGTSITGDVGYTTGPAVVPTISGSTHVADAAYQQAGTAQNTATSVANSQVCTTHLGTSVDLSLVHGGVYTPGVYCTTGAASIGSGGITLSGNGIYIFQINGALTTVVNSGMTLSNGAQASNISWVPTQATTLGANSNFAGIILDASGVTIGHNVSMTGKVLAFGGTVSTSADTISVSSNTMSDIAQGNFGILASSYTNTSPGTSISGDLGYTTGPAVPASVSGSTHVADSVYQQSGTAQNAATSFANSRVCTTNLGTTVDLSLVHGGVYTPGVYCTTGAASIGTGGITLSGNGIYIFQINGALTTVVNSNVVLTNGAQASGVSWVPTQATTLGANSNFAGIILDASGVTIGHNVSMNGRVWAFGGTVSTDADTITVSSYALADAIPGNFASLGTAGNFAVLGSTTVTNTGNTVVTGNLGLSPNTSITGFPPGVVTGVTHTADSSAAQARTDATAAYTALSSATCTTNEPLSADIGGQTLKPGVYCFPSSAAITGTLTLDGNGMYVFKTGSTLVTAAGNSHTVLTNGASSSNVFWQVGSSATLGTYSNFKGTIIASQSVTATTGASIDGRLIALNGAVTLDTNKIAVSSNAMSDAISGNFAILSSTYTNTLSGTSMSGDLGYTTGPALASTVNGIIHVADSVYQQAGTAQNVATSAANAQACTTNLGTTVDLSQVQSGVYTPGVYCTTGAASIGSGGITLSGNGIYIFKIQGALTTVSGSTVSLNGAQASRVFWVPIAATTLGANSNFAGSILDAAGVTINHNVNMAGRVLAFGGTVSTDSDTITVPSYTMSDVISGNFQCTVTFPPGAIDLGSNVQYPDKVYPPGVYCIDGAANIGSGPITLSGNGAHIFKINGALGQVANSDVILANGAQVSGVIWMPTGAITIGANSHLIGTVNGAPITIGANSDINGIGPAKTMSDAVSGNLLCTVTFPTGAIDLGSNVQYPDKVYPPGVYCIDGAANIGSGPITLTGNGAHIFKINGALGQAANTDVILTSGAQASSIIWIPSGATTIGANSHLVGTVNGAPITIGANSDISGMGPAMIMADAISNNSQCTVTFPPGAIDLGSNVQYPDKVYPPGVYCIDGAANIGSGPITLSGNGAHIFKINGALGQVANSDVILANGAQVSGVIWVPTGAITIGANSNLIGTVDGAPITIGANSAINGVGPQIMADATSGNFAILSSTYTNTLSGTSISGDLGYTTGPSMPSTIDGIIHVADSVYQQAGTAQNAATSYANAQACTVSLGTTVDLSQVQGGVYTPGVYCTTGATSIGSGGITLSGNGIYIFKIQGALTTVSGSTVHLNGAQASDVSWVPIAATTLGANSNFAGIILDAAGVTINHNVNMAGRVLAFGGTVSTDSDTITVPSYAMADVSSGNLPCTVTFPTGAIDLGSNVQYPDKVYPPGVYCIDGAANIGSGPITLTGNGAHIFKINGALGQAANTDVILSNGALASGVIWVPTGATTIGANSHLIGTVNGAPITIGANSDINGVGPAKTMSDATTPSGPLYATGDATVPEFGTIAAMILIIGIASIIAVSARTRLGIMPKY